MAHNPQRPAPRASGLRPIVPRRWDAARPQRWSGWRRALGNWRRPLRALAVRSTFRKAASCWRCRRSWSAGCCGTLPSTFACQLAFTVSPASFCFWPSWRWAGSGRSRPCGITRRENGANCWASTVLQRCAPCASSSSIWLTRNRRFPLAQHCARTGCWKPPKRRRFFTSMGMCASTTARPRFCKHYVARERLCLSATADYWVNAMDGEPFFVVSQAADPGLLQVLERDIVPRLEQDVPNQPSTEQLDADPLLHRFSVVFDREGYSPDFFAKMKKRRIACLTYHKYPGQDWPRQEFFPTDVRLSSGEQTIMQLAERGTQLSNGLWVREFRKRSQSGRQTAFLSTDYRSSGALLAPALFSRWSQENFFRYMRQHDNLDGLIDYGTEGVPETTMVVNPAYRAL